MQRFFKSFRVCLKSQLSLIGVGIKLRWIEKSVAGQFDLGNVAVDH